MCLRQMKAEVLLLRVHNVISMSKMADSFIDGTTQLSITMDVKALPMLEILICNRHDGWVATRAITPQALRHVSKNCAYRLEFFYLHANKSDCR